MIWQDWVITIGQAILAASLIPSIISKDKPAFTTSLMTGSILYIFAITFFTLGLLFASGVVALTAFFWTILAVQKLKKKS